ncbi:mannitol dehydrogenase family protein [Allorhodopirellula solitaria]|uniref:Mannitol 2-dehydrogenase n=1 Tax=Allorhodopirellula solitaria TaxID=2527987 RepID=A0A5C5YFI0_9BACT|nr:mannitol dehydrogenase family protein [Allorhodopirellula solitaria]TWT74050.1 Mannitol 2-dehydrogenase [Allorhodopirellula solitaria]
MSEILELNQTNLPEILGSVARPNYDRTRVKTGIVHVGVGGFHRAHQAAYTDRLLSTGQANDWGICGVGIRQGDLPMQEALEQQDHLYTLMVKYPDRRIETSVLGAIVDFVCGVEDAEPVIARMAHADTRIVSLTITEGGYNVAADTGEFDLSSPDAQHDLTHPTKPRLVFGYLTEALRRRRALGLPAFTVQSCDNIQHNGDLTRRMLLGFARHQDPELAKWIEERASFPNAMVDRITPVTTDADIEFLKSEHGFHDRWPVTCEPFCQWVIEDNFASGRPAWEQVGAQFVPDVVPYETMKLRLLNAGHSVLGILGAVHGHQTINDCIADDRFAHYVRRFMDVEATPTLDPVPGIELNDYKDTLIERFGNPNIRDSVARICLQSSSKLPVFLLPTINANLNAGRSINLATLVIATWCLFCDRQADENGKPLEIVDDLKDELHAAARGTTADKLSFIKFKPVFGELANHPQFSKTYSEMIDRIYANQGIAAEMDRVIKNSPDK